MPKLAIIADVHGNICALQAVLADIKAREINDVVNLGDCVSGPLWPRETMDLLQRLELPSVRGNHDRWLGEAERAGMGACDALAFDRLTSAQIAALAALPPRLKLGSEIVAIHGSPRSNVEYLLEDVVDGRLWPTDPGRLRERLGATTAAVLLCAHSLQARIVNAHANLLVINPGSVGCPGYLDLTPPAHVSEAGSPRALRRAAAGRTGMAG